MIKAIQLLTVFNLLCCSMVQAGTIVEIQNNNELARIFTDGQRARMNMDGADYAIVDYNNHSIKLVDPQKQQVMLMNTEGLAADSTTPVVNTSLKHLGPGQDIAGYKTQKFGYSANGQSCGVIYGSHQAYQSKGIKQLLDAMNIMMDKQRAALGGFARLIDACKLADMNIGSHVNTIGAPMRTEKNGRINTEIKSIKVDVVLPADIFVVPASYKTVSLQQPMQLLSNGKTGPSQQRPRKNTPPPPQMQDMMRQRQQQSGQLTPAMMEQMRRAQGMQRQYQR